MAILATGGSRLALDPPIDQWTAEERAQLAVPEFDPSYLPDHMMPPDCWFSASGVYLGVTVITER